MSLRAFPQPHVATYLLDKLKNSRHQVVNTNILATLVSSFSKNYSQAIVEVIKIKMYNSSKSFIKEALISLDQIKTPEAQTLKNQYLEENPQHARLLK